MPNEDVPWLLVERYCAGSCTPDEAAALAAWAAGHPERQRLLERMRVLFGDSNPTPDKAEIERAWAVLSKRLDLPRKGTDSGEER